MDLKYKGRRIAFGFCSVNLPKVPLFSSFHFTLKGSMILVIFFEVGVDICCIGTLIAGEIM